MPRPASFPSELLRISAHGYAGLAAELLLSDDEAAATSLSFEAWKASMMAWVIEVDAALQDGEPDSFIRHLDWVRRALRARGVDDATLRRALELLASVLDRELPAGARAPVAALLTTGIAHFDVALSIEASELDPDDESGRLAAEYVLALLEGRRREATALVLDAVKTRDLDVATAYVDVLAPAQRELGRLWHLGEATVAEEHLVTATTTALMAALMAQAPRRESNGRTVVCASIGGDTHDVGLRMVSDLFELDGWHVLFLGADLPSEAVGSAVTTFNANLLALSATLASHRRDVREAIGVVRNVAPECLILVGGPAFASGASAGASVGADAVAGSAHEAVTAGRGLVGLDD